MRIYEDPQKTSENRLPPRSYYIPGGKSEYTLLNGEWRFAYFGRDIDVPETITQWDTIPVPSCWQLQGYGQPNYTNWSYPFPVDPPYVPDDNPCGVYEREFTLKQKWGRVYFVFEGVCSCAFLYMNGNYVGFTQGSHLQAEFDVTSFVAAGTNTVRVKVLKWSCGSYLEDQDMFRYNGIFRDCYLLQRPQGHIGDVEMIPNDRAIEISLRGEAQVRILDGEILLQQDRFTDHYSFAPEHPVLWNAEKPHLYTVELERGGEVIRLKTGLRRISVSSEYALLVNGTEVKLHGVNHHDTSKYRGWCISDDEMRRDLLLMKELNINCVRTSHYPPPPRFLEMCDALGFYVVLENDIETHGFIQTGDLSAGHWPAGRPVWRKEFLERMARALEVNKNHPSIFMWSIGNENCQGVNITVMIEWLQQRDPSRLTHNEGAWRGDFGGCSVFSKMYPSLAQTEAYARDAIIDRPVYLCEYSHAMGNGPGDVWDYNELFDRYPKLIGGCIWEWVDHVVDVDGVQKYGGDFEDELTSDGNYCCNGLLFADRTFKSGTLEAKAAYQPVRTDYADGELSIYNRYDFTDLAECKLYYTIERDGEVVLTQPLDISAPPHTAVTVPVPYEPMECQLGVTLNCYLEKDGRRYAATQHVLPCMVQSTEADGAAGLTEDAEHIYIRGSRFAYTFSKHYGTFTSIQVDGREQLEGPVQLTAFRAPTDNDIQIAEQWRQERLDKLFTKIYSCAVEQNTIVVSASLAGVSQMPFFHYTVTYAFDRQGRVDITLDGRVRDNAAWLPRLGFELELPQASSEFTYYGRGPQENYCDLYHAALVGLYRSDAGKEYVPYVRPQEHGNHTGVKRLAIGGLCFSSQQGFECCVSNYSTAALTAAQHTDELVQDGKVHLRVDYRVSGVGSNACGPELEPKYRLAEKEIHFTVTMQPRSY